jgi:hypothetical protein
MKRIGYILTEQTVTDDVCRTAIMDAAKGKYQRLSVRRILRNIDTYAAKLRSMILNGTYKPKPYKECHIIDKPSKKARILEKPVFFPDQCIHHVTINLIKDRLIKRLDPYCIGGIKNKGIHYGHRAITRWLKNDKKHTKYCLKGDVRKCYESIKPEVIMRAMKRFIKDRRFLNLIKTIVYSHKTLPLGNYTSGWFANIVLLELDKAARADPACKHYLRYADDFIVLGNNKRKLRKIVDKIKEALKRIGLELKGNWQIFPTRVRGIDMLGYRFFGDYTLMRKRNILSLIRAIRKYKKHRTKKLARGLLSRIGQLIHFNSFNFHQKYVKGLGMKKLKEMAT